MWRTARHRIHNRIRIMARALATAANWIFNFLITVTFPPLLDLSLGLTYGLYALFALGSFFFVLAKIPETRAMELEEMTMETMSRKKSGVSQRRALT